MAWAARTLARDLRREGRFHGNYVIDMGLTERGVAAIEVNTFTGAGLYAVDYGRVARALGRWYADPARRPAGGFLESDVSDLAFRLLFKAVSGEVPKAGGGMRGIVGRAADAVMGRGRRKAAAVEGTVEPTADEAVAALATWAMRLSRAEDRGWRDAGAPGDDPKR
jgi:hypothetical protein